MGVLYIKPLLNSYSAVDVVEELGPCQNQYTTTLYTTIGNSSINLDGNTGSNGWINTDNSQFQVGDDDNNIHYVGFVGFDISSLQGRTITSATLRVYQANVDPDAYTDIGSVYVDDVIFGDSLDAGDYSYMGTLIGTISDNNTIEWKSLDVTSYVQDDIDNGRTPSQFRLGPNTTTNDNNMDRALFRCVESTEADGPQLVVIYQ